VSRSYFSLRWVVRSCTRRFNIASNSGVYWFQASNDQNITGRPQVLGRSVREFIHPISIGPPKWSCLQPQIQMGRRIVPVCLLQTAAVCSLEKKIHQIEGNYNLIKKNGWKTTYHKVSSSAIHELLHPFLTAITSHMCFNKKFYQAWLASMNCSLQDKNVVS